MNSEVIKKKTSPEQLNLLIDFISSHKIMLHGKTKPSEDDSNAIEALWQDVTIALNSCGTGPSKTVSQWKKTFIDWKSHTKKKARGLIKSQKQTGGGEGVQLLTPIEEKLMSAISWISVTGVTAVDEVGVSDDTKTQSTEVTTIDEETTTPQELPVTSSLKRTAAKDENEPSMTKRVKKNCQDKASTLLKVAELYAASQKSTVEILHKIEKICGENNEEMRRKELELKEVELKIRLLEAKHKARELDLKEKELEIRSKELLLKERNLL